MAIEHATIALTQTAALVSHDTSSTSVDRPDQTVGFVNETGVDVRVGGAGVTTATGCLVSPGASFSLTFPITDDLYAVCASGSHNLFVIRSL